MITQVVSDLEHLLQQEVNNTLDNFRICVNVHAYKLNFEKYIIFIYRSIILSLQCLVFV